MSLEAPQVVVGVSVVEKMFLGGCTRSIPVVIAEGVGNSQLPLLEKLSADKFMSENHIPTLFTSVGLSSFFSLFPIYRMASSINIAPMPSPILASRPSSKAVCSLPPSIVASQSSRSSYSKSRVVKYVLRNITIV